MSDKVCAPAIPTPKPASERPLTCGVRKLQREANSQARDEEFEFRDPITHGRDSFHGHFPWQVALYYDKGGHGYNPQFMCGGSLISKKHAVTAAHCLPHWFDKKRFIAVLGDFDTSKPEEGTEQHVKVKSITLHENWNFYTDPVSGTIKNDIAILELEEEAKLSDHIEPICLPTKEEANSKDMTCMLSGWGKKHHSQGRRATPILNELDVSIVSHAECVRQRRGLTYHSSHKRMPLTEKMLCTVHKNGNKKGSGCQGDSGGPVSCKLKGQNIWKLFGVISYANGRCDGHRLYTVSTRVSSYLDWIKPKIR